MEKIEAENINDVYEFNKYLNCYALNENIFDIGDSYLNSNKFKNTIEKYFIGKSLSNDVRNFNYEFKNTTLTVYNKNNILMTTKNSNDRKLLENIYSLGVCNEEFINKIIKYISINKFKPIRYKYVIFNSLPYHNYLLYNSFLSYLSSSLDSEYLRNIMI